MLHRDDWLVETALIPGWRIGTQQVPPKEIVTFVIAVGRITIAAGRAVIRTRHYQQVEILIVLDQLMHDLAANPFRVESIVVWSFPELSLRSNSGLKLANAFGVSG